MLPSICHVYQRSDMSTFTYKKLIQIKQIFCLKVTATYTAFAKKNSSTKKVFGSSAEISAICECAMKLEGFSGITITK